MEKTLKDSPESPQSEALSIVTWWWLSLWTWELGSLYLNAGFAPSSSVTVGKLPNLAFALVSPPIQGEEEQHLPQRMIVRLE